MHRGPVHPTFWGSWPPIAPQHEAVRGSARWTEARTVVEVSRALSSLVFTALDS